jgi:hypothetical protein
MRIQVFDSLLFTVNTREEKLIHVFNLKSQKKIGERISSGQGPGEMLQPYFVKIDTAWVHLFDMSSFTLYVYATKDFITNQLPLDYGQLYTTEEASKIIDKVVGDSLFYA